jgi:guanylate kinase
MNKLVIISAPSGAGKSTIVKALRQKYPQLTLSISACTRNPRAGEENGVHYYFLTVEEFQNKIETNEFLEWEMVYEGKYYGTPQSELKRIWHNNGVPILDIDVAGALNVMKLYKGNYCSIFIETPDLKILKERLINRGTETAESLQERLDKAKYELEFKNEFQHIIVNDILEEAIDKISTIISEYLNK